jgi:hypothetical protein
MTVLPIQTDDQLMTALRLMAEQQATTVESLIRDVLAAYVKLRGEPEKKTYSFIGIGKSGRGDLSVRAEEILTAETIAP